MRSNPVGVCEQAGNSEYEEKALCSPIRRGHRGPLKTPPNCACGKSIGDSVYPANNTEHVPTFVPGLVQSGGRTVVSPSATVLH